MDSAGPPEIHIFRGHAPELVESDLNIVIDVIRAFTTTHLAFEHGADKIVLAGEVDEARALKADHPDYVLAGERDAIKIEGFDLGNSPHACTEYDLDGRAMILSTTNGVRATLNALHDGSVLVTGFSNAAQTADHVARLAAEGRVRRVNLIASNPTDDDDLACAEFIRERLLGTDRVDADAVVRRIRGCASAQKFLDPDRPKYDRRDVELCMTPRRSNFVMEVIVADGRPVVVTRPTDSVPRRPGR